MPPFKRLAFAGLAVDAPLVALFLIYANVRGAVSVVAGGGLALALYGMLYWIVAHGLEDADSARATRGTPGGNSLSVMRFAAAMIGKYVLIGALLFLAWKTGYLAALPFVAGFVVCQIAITWLSVRQMKKPIA